MEALEPRLALALSNYIAPDGTSWQVDQTTGMPYFHSNTSAGTTIYMDYDGDPGTKNPDTNYTAMAPWDTDGNSSTFMASEERNRMWEDWRRLTTYFAPFNVDVSTQYVNPTSRSVAWLCVSPTQNQFPNARFSIGSFGKTDQFAYGFIGPGWGSEVFAHEVGHSFGNVHQANVDEFFQESQSYGGPTFSVNGGPVDLLNGAIMGAKSGTINKFLTWNRVGTYDVLQDSQATIASAIAAKVGGTGYRTDDYVNSYGTTASTIGSGIPKKGVIETLGDVDYFKFDVTTAGAGYSIALTRDLNSPVDLNLIVQNSSGGLVASFNGDTRSVVYQQMVNDAHLMLPSLATGTYYIRVAGNANGGDVGPYFLRLDRAYDTQWRSTDIGQSPDGGYAYQSTSNNTYVVRGSGSDIWGTADGGHFLYKQLSGDGDILASPMSFSMSITSTDEWAKMGIMMRPSLDPSAPAISLIDSWNNGVQLQYRTTWYGETASLANSGGGAFVPNQGSRYFRLSRRGNVLSAYLSTDNGATFNQLGSSVTVSGWGTIYVGLVTTSHNNGSAISGGFSNATVIPVGAGQINPSGVSLNTSLPVPNVPLPSQNLGGSTTYTWNRVNDANVTGYYVERSVNNVDWTFDTIVSQPASGNLSVTETGLNDNCYYYYRVRSRNAQGYVSNPSNGSGFVLIQPKAVTNLRAVVSSINIMLQWRDAAGESGYRVQYSDNYSPSNPGAATWNTPINSDTAANIMFWEDSSLPTSRAYRVQTLQGSTVTATSSVLVTGKQIAPATGLNISGITTGTITLSWTAPTGVTGGVTYTVQRSETRTPLSWITQISGLSATTYTNTTSPGKAYYYRVISQSTATGGRSPSAVVFRGSWGALPSGYSDATVGTVGGYGAVNSSNGVITITGSGADVWGTSDNMHYMYKSLTGAQTMTVHVTSLGSGDDFVSNQDWARAGITFRDGTGSGAAEIGIFATRKYGVVLQSRTSTNGNTGMIAQESNPSGSFRSVWLKLSRSSGGGFTGRYSYDSADGTLSSGTWFTLGTAQTISAIPNNYLGGLAVSSHDNNYLYTATFENLT